MRLNESILKNLNESNGMVDDACLEYLGLVQDDLSMMSTWEEDSIKFKSSDVDTLICYALELREDANKLVEALRNAKRGE